MQPRAIASSTRAADRSSPLTVQPRVRKPMAIEPPIRPRPMTFARLIADRATQSFRAIVPSTPSSGPVRWCCRDGEAAHLLGGASVAPLAGLQPPIGERSDAHADEAAHGMADRLAHPPDLAVATFVDRDPQDSRRRLGHLGRGGRSIVELDSFAQGADRRRADAASARRPRPRRGTPCRRPSTGGRHGWPARRRWSAGAGPRCRRRGGPTGNTRGSVGTSSTTVGRPWVSRAVVTTPAGLLSR